MNAAELKIKIFRQVDLLDSRKLDEVYGVLMNYVNGNVETNEWIGVNHSEQQNIEAAIKELDSGKGIPHEQIMNKYRKKYSDA